MVYIQGGLQDQIGHRATGRLLGAVLGGGDASEEVSAAARRMGAPGGRGDGPPENGPSSVTTSHWTPLGNFKGLFK